MKVFAQFNWKIMCYAEFANEIAPVYSPTQENVPYKITLTPTGQLIIIP